MTKRAALSLRAVLLISLTIGISWFPVAWAELNNGLVAYYPFDGNANDESGNGNHGTVHGATLTEDRFGNADSAYEFDGIQSRIKLMKNAMDGLNSLSIGFWLKTNDSGSIKSFISGANSSQHNEFLIIHDGPSVFTYLKGNDAGIGHSIINDGIWHYLTITRSSSEIKLYIDGGYDSPLWYTAPTGTLTIDTSGLWLGGDQDCVGGCWESSQQYDGVLDDIRIYNRALTECEIKSLYTGEDECNENELDHFLCYKVKPSGNFKKRKVLVHDQFGTMEMQVIKPNLLCTPAALE
jgi:hypothetical protein